MLAKVENGVVAKWPCTVSDIKKENPRTSFPSPFPDALLGDLGYVRFEYRDRGDFDSEFQEAVEVTPTIVGGVAVQTWEIRERYSSAEKSKILSDKAAQALIDDDISNRKLRDDFLSETDWTQVADAPVDATRWASYRQLLRDLPNHANWPNLDEADWPTKPD
jgi:hypothetical protein